MMTLASDGCAGIAGVSPASCERAGRPRSRKAPARTGFTLVELLVATGIFVLGFSVCLGLFLAGMRHRSAAEDHLRLGFAASSLIEEIGLGTTPTGLVTTPKPSDYLTPFANDALQSVPGHANVWYRIESCTNAVVRSDDPTASMDAATADTLLTKLLVISFATANPPATMTEINRRLRIVDPKTFDPHDAAQVTKVTDYLLSRQLALRMETVILRRAP